jgi:TPR repeat protein
MFGSYITAANPIFLQVIGCFCLLCVASVSSAKELTVDEGYEEAIIRTAKTGDSQSQFALALIYEYGTDIIERDPDMAIQWLQKAAKGKVAAACLYLGMKYEYGNRVENDLKKAACWYRCAAYQDWPPAQYFLAGLYEKGKGVKQSNFLALAWFGIAAKQDYPGAAANFSRLFTQEGLKDLAKLRVKQRKLMGKVGTPCN